YVPHQMLESRQFGAADLEEMVGASSGFRHGWRRRRKHRGPSQVAPVAVPGLSPAFDRILQEIWRILAMRKPV
ncbi:hypothetical protein BGZ74_004553, partial [Mortierella antarctica]